MVRISIIGAGSVAFSSKIIRDLCLTEDLWGSTVTLMDINEERLKIAYLFATRYCKEVKAELKFEATTDRKKALQDVDFVICTVKVGGYEPMEAERRIAERYGYYRGIGDRVSDYYGGVGAYHQLKFFLRLAREMEELCPDAWLIETANPVFEGTTLLSRETKVKVVGVCHGHLAYKQLVKALNLDVKEVEVEMAGFNHCIWLTRLLWRGEDAYPLIDEWIESKAEEYWRSREYLAGYPWNTEQLSPGAVDMYRLFGLFPIGDTVRSASPWWHHIDFKTKQKWYGPSGGFDSEVGWSLYLKLREEKLKKLTDLIRNPSASLVREFPPVPSEEQHVPIIDSIANDKKRVLQLNILNKGLIAGIPDDVVVEVPAVVDGRGIRGLPVGSLPKRLMLHVIMPRMRRMEQILQAFKEGDKTTLLLMLMEDPRTKSFEQAKALLEEILAQPWNVEAREHYR